MMIMIRMTLACSFPLIIIIRMEEELGNPHLVSLVTDYNVMPVRNKYF